ncbi:transcriptional regulator, TetR family [Porphyromonadaceae bacterium NLAE-zl-C104]|jgi:AcrR family transcriptional regulator|uniref:TetR/AcrR family transcriptional regulator n=1 Tax=Proteiniphilum TaxID=294702 RepID=UPI000894C2A9|nr:MULTISPECIES: TetR/AcrR family transcriptional regulator [Proteiniphilum]MDY9918184.1 TetR/AcrR family transcriptional regulator [Proteiniphilum sp.]SDZ82693.1 transcriptional regulator, TetR family [Porphyromonadaceae bacterium KH3R12]SFS29944.1 transcriptional regulator, TetR family [Porphyromonadaceae bacterium NLAE-zl-C104]
MTKKQNDIFEAAKRLFYKFGVKKVTIEEICEEANVSKMTFYKYFPNKIELVKAVIDNYYSTALDKYEAMMQSDLTAEEKVRKTFELKLENASTLDMEFVSDLYKYPDDTIREHLEAWRQKNLDVTKKWFIEMQQSGQIIKELSFPVFILYVNAIQDFTFNDETMKFFGTTHELARIITRLFMYGIAENKDG